MTFIEIEQIRSSIRREESQRATLLGLGLGKIGRVRCVENTPAIRGMIRKVSHLVTVRHDPATPKLAPAQPAYDEAADAALLRALAFDWREIVPEVYSHAERMLGKTPDFKLVKDGVLSGYCEMKAPRDDYVIRTPANCGTDIRENVPYYRKLGNDVRDAAEQLRAVNKGHDLPNILAFISHTPQIERQDLIATIAGLRIPGSGRRLFMFGKKTQKKVVEAAKAIDLFLWIDANERKLQHLSPHRAVHLQAALDLLGLKNGTPAP